MFASMVLVGDNVVTVSRNNGTTIWKTNKDEFELVRQNVIQDDDSNFNGTPAIDSKQIFIRSNKCLYCISK